MQPEEAIEIDGSLRRTRDRPRNRDRRPHPVIRLFTVGYDDVERIGRAALEETDQHFSTAIAVGRGTANKLHAVDAPPKEARVEPHRHHRESAGFHEDTTIHANLPGSEERY